MFCDSSQLAYSTVAYITYTTMNRTRNTFIVSKIKVAPIKQQTLPQLEQLATLLGAKLAKYLSQNILEHLKPFQMTLWSDCK